MLREGRFPFAPFGCTLPPAGTFGGYDIPYGDDIAAPLVNEALYQKWRESRWSLAGLAAKLNRLAAAFWQQSKFHKS